jgi:hypothetical protein
MTERISPLQSLRAVLSMGAVSSAVLLCHSRQHFTIGLAHPSTWLAATQHRCGWALIASLAWFSCETIYHMYLRGRHRPNTYVSWY